MTAAGGVVLGVLSFARQSRANHVAATRSQVAGYVDLVEALQAETSRLRAQYDFEVRECRSQLNAVRLDLARLQTRVIELEGVS